MALVFVVRDLWVILCMLFLTLFAGMFPFACEILGECEGLGAIIGILFFPVLMIMGIGRAFGEFFCEPASGMMSDYCEMFRSGVESICEI